MNLHQPLDKKTIFLEVQETNTTSSGWTPYTSDTFTGGRWEISSVLSFISLRKIKIK